MMTGVFSVAMNLVAVLASGFSIAIGEWTDLGWKGSLGIWTFWALLALFALGIETFSGKKKPVKRTSVETVQFTPSFINISYIKTFI